MICEGDDFGTFVSSGHDFVVVDEVVLVGGNKQATAEFYIGTTLSFGDPFGVLFKEGVELFFSGDFTSFQKAVADQKDVFDEEILPVFDRINFTELEETEGLAAKLFKGGTEFFFEVVELGEVVGGSANDAILLVGSSAFAGSGAGSHGVLNTALPVVFFTPPSQANFSGETTGEFNGFARSIPG